MCSVSFYWSKLVIKSSIIIQPELVGAIKYCLTNHYLGPFHHQVASVENNYALQSGFKAEMR